jgi:hypothetical protein
MTRTILIVASSRRTARGPHGIFLKQSGEKLNAALGGAVGIARTIEQDGSVPKAGESIVIHSLTWLGSSCSVESHRAFFRAAI